MSRMAEQWQEYQEQDNLDGNKLEDFRVFQQAPINSSLYLRGMVRGPKGQFEEDARNDRLPTVSWIVPTGRESEHPDHMPAAGAAFVARHIDAIAANPKVWAKTVFILCYDENDGLFDHVVPPTPPTGTPREYVDGKPIGAGFRVPCIVVSPWSAGGWVCSQPFDHTSILRLVEKLTGVIEPNITPWRRQTFGDMTATFRFSDEMAGPAKLPSTHEFLHKAKDGVFRLPKPTLPGADQRAPAQEKGFRKRVPRV